jgi:4-amino-4-deoxy-L-arabinose transferase-like glycosyltransferase
MKQTLFENKNKLVLFLLVIVILLRISVLFFAYSHPERTFTNDSPSYIEPAQFLLRDHAYTHPSALRTPAYPLFLAGIFALFGEQPFYVVLAQVLIGLATIFFTYKMSSDLFPGQNGLQGILLLGLGLESILSPFYLMTETLFTFLLVLIAFSLLRYKRSLKIGWALAAAVFSALAILCRPIALYLPVLILFFFIWANRQKWLVAVRTGAVYLLVTVMLVIPWVVRNNYVVGLPIVSSITGDSLLFYSANALRAHENGITFFESQGQLFEEFEQRAMQEGIPYTEKDRYHLKISMGKEIIARAPMAYLWVHVRDSLKVFLPGTASLNDMLGLPGQSIGIWDILQTKSLSSALKSYFEQTGAIQLLLLPFIFLLFITILGSAIGSFVLFKDKNWFALLFLLIPLLYLILLSGPGSYSRFRVPLMPFLSILAGIGLLYMKKLIWRKTK